jgi:plasmid stabilization system protein ParE
MRRIEFSRLAWIDLDRLEGWLAANGAPYAADLGAALRDAIASLREFPNGVVIPASANCVS